MEIRQHDIQEFVNFAEKQIQKGGISWEKMTDLWIQQIKKRDEYDLAKHDSIYHFLENKREAFGRSGGKFLTSDEVRTELLNRRGGVQE